MSTQQGRAHRKRATLCFSLLTAATIAMHVPIAKAAAQPPPPPATQPITLMWEPPTENTNGSALVDLKAYRIYSGTTRRNLKARITLRNPGLATYVLKPASTAERYYAISAINSKGVESELSNLADSKR